MKKTWLVLTALALATAGCDMDHHDHAAWKCKDKQEKEAPEVKVPFDQTPAAVQATLAAEAPGVAIKDVDKEDEDGKTTYEADTLISGTNYEIKVATDGKLISKKIDNEADEKPEAKTGEKDEKNEKGEH